jgi:hypothetical protein
MNNGTSVTKKLVSVFMLNGKVLIKNLPADQGTISNLRAKYTGNDKLLFYHTLPLDDRKYPIFNPAENKKNEKNK